MSGMLKLMNGFFRISWPYPLTEITAVAANARPILIAELGKDERMMQTIPGVGMAATCLWESDWRSDWRSALERHLYL